MKIARIGLLCLLLGRGAALASPPRNLRATPGGYALAPEAERDDLIEAIRKIHGLGSLQEAVAVYFARAAKAEGESRLAEEFIREWADLLRVQVSPDLPETAALGETYDLDDTEAALVLLVRRTFERPEKGPQANVLLAKYFDALAKRAAEKRGIQ